MNVFKRIELSTRENLARILAASLSPQTLAAAIADLDRNDQIDGFDQAWADMARASFATQLNCMVGEEESNRLVQNAT